LIKGTELGNINAINGRPKKAYYRYNIALSLKDCRSNADFERRLIPRLSNNSTANKYS
jgi:hypothetical protein